MTVLLPFGVPGGQSKRGKHAGSVRLADLWVSKRARELVVTVKAERAANLRQLAGLPAQVYLKRPTAAGAGTRQFGDGNTEFTAVSLADAQNGWAVGFNNLVMHTTDGGANWTPQDVDAPPVTAITGVTAVNSTTAWIADWNGFVARTVDGGQTWRRERIAGAEQVDFEDALFLDAQTGWVGGNIGIWKRSRSR